MNLIKMLVNYAVMLKRTIDFCTDDQSECSKAQLTISDILRLL
jgi:hypothetical protein